MLSLDPDVNTHPSPNLSLTSETTTIQMVDTQPQWPLHLHAIQVRNGSKIFEYFSVTMFFCKFVINSRRTNVMLKWWSGWLYHWPQRTDGVLKKHIVLICIISLSKLHKRAAYDLWKKDPKTYSWFYTHTWKVGLSKSSLPTFSVIRLKLNWKKSAPIANMIA